MQKLLNILFWSVITAAFIGPGTVTTAASAGAQYKYALLWALTFSTIACLVLQEASARITIVSGKNLGEAIREQFSEGVSGITVIILVVGAIIIGCAAYQTGNILGGVAGAELATGISKSALTVTCGLIAGLLLWFGSTEFVAKALGVVVALMGMAFLATAIVIGPSAIGILKGSLLPSFPEDSGLLIMGLIGTTVVPYNLFLGSGLASQSKSLADMRYGLAIAIILGGVISMAALVVGTAIDGGFSFQALSEALRQNLGDWAGVFFAFGLFAAGFSSAITAPLAAAITAKSLFAKNNPGWWQPNAIAYRAVWLVVLATGVFFGLTDVRPIPAIILAQAFNGVLLPLIAVFLFIVMNNSKLMGAAGINRTFANVVMAIVVFITVLLGVANVLKALAETFGFQLPGEMIILGIAGVVAVGVFMLVWSKILRREHRE